MNRRDFLRFGLVSGVVAVSHKVLPATTGDVGAKGLVMTDNDGGLFNESAKKYVAKLKEAPYAD